MGKIIRIIVVMGLMIAVSYPALMPFFNYQATRKCPSTTGVVLSTKRITLLFVENFRNIDFSYNVNSEKRQARALMHEDKWVRDLKEGDKIPVRYFTDEKNLAAIDHDQNSASILHALLNAFAVIVLFLVIPLLTRKKQ